jgi:hypothetical protein
MGRGGRPKEIPRSCITRLVYCRYAGPLSSRDVGQVSFEILQDGSFSSKCRSRKGSTRGFGAPSTPTSPRGRSLVQTKRRMPNRKIIHRKGVFLQGKEALFASILLYQQFSMHARGPTLQLRGVECSPLSAPLSSIPEFFLLAFFL